MPSVGNVSVGGKVTAAKENEQTGWINAEGLIGIVPTSVSASSGTATVGAAGKVAFTTATTVSVNGCFTSTYDNYLIAIDATHSAANNLTARLRFSGTDNSAAQYSFVSHFASGSAASVVSTPSATSMAGNFSNTRISGSLTLFGPAIAATTVWQLETASILTATTMGVFKQGGQHTVSSAFDGITFIPSAGSITGTLRIYGYNSL